MFRNDALRSVIDVSLIFQNNDVSLISPPFASPDELGGNVGSPVVYR